MTSIPKDADTIAWVPSRAAPWAPTASGVGRFPPLWLSWTVWGVAATFYLSGFYLRVAPAVMTAELMRDFRITAAELGQFSALYFYTYVLMQIPTGVLVDSWGARRLLVLGAGLAAAGTFLFGMTGSVWLAGVGRATVGAATAVGWVVTLKLATHWFPAQRFATMSGLGLLVGNLGALAAQVPLRLLVEHFGWRSVLVASGGVVLAIGAVAWGVVRNDPGEKGCLSYAPEVLQRTDHIPIRELARGFLRVFGYRNTWLIFAAQGGFVGSMLGFTGLWGPPYLQTRFGLSPATAAAVCSVMIVCWAMASPLAGYLSDKLGRRKPIYIGGAMSAALGWATLFYLPGLPVGAFVVLAAATSVACGAVILGFAYAKESVPVQFLGTVSGAINVGNMLGPTLLQPIIGWILDRQWSGAMSGGVRVYTAGEFHAAFSVIVAWLCVSVLLIGLTRETYCRPSA
jgi:sugar phosphate permease